MITNFCLNINSFKNKRIVDAVTELVMIWQASGDDGHETSVPENDAMI